MKNLKDIFTEDVKKYVEYMNIAQRVGEKSTCIKHKVGSILVNNGEIIAEGYNHFPLARCDETNCKLNEMNKCVNGIHSEADLLLKASPEERKGATLIITLYPCSNCQLLILKSGVNKVIYKQEHMPKVDFLKDCDTVTIVSLSELIKELTK